MLEQPSDNDDNDDEEVVYYTPLATGPTNDSSPLNFVFHEPERRPEKVDFPITHCYFKALTNTYLTNVDPISKILQRPTTLSSIAAGTSNFSAPWWLLNNGAIELLMLCMYFAAVTSQSPEECQQTYHQYSQTLLAKFRHGAELAFARENLLVTIESAALQAFVR